MSSDKNGTLGKVPIRIHGPVAIEFLEPVKCLIRGMEYYGQGQGLMVMRAKP